MGKSIIIPGIDAGKANLGQVELASVIDITSNIQLIISTNSSSGCQYLHYPEGNLNDAFQRHSSLVGNMIAYVDVSAYKGKRLLTYIADRSASPTWYYMAFASSVNHTTNLSSNTAVQNAITPVQRLVGKGIGGLIKSEYTIPEDANYFVFSVYEQSYDKIYIKVLQ